MENSVQTWSLECKPFGQSGYVFYHEGSRELPLYWEYGGGDTIVVVRVEEPEKLGARFPWVVGRERVILERIAQELVRQQAPGARTEIDEKDLAIYVREQNQRATS
jgi:hypothetical protein